MEYRGEYMLREVEKLRLRSMALQTQRNELLQENGELQRQWMVHCAMSSILSVHLEGQKSVVSDLIDLCAHMMPHVERRDKDHFINVLQAANNISVQQLQSILGGERRGELKVHDAKSLRRRKSHPKHRAIVRSDPVTMETKNRSMMKKDVSVGTKSCSNNVNVLKAENLNRIAVSLMAASQGSTLNDMRLQSERNSRSSSSSSSLILTETMKRTAASRNSKRSLEKTSVKRHSLDCMEIVLDRSTENVADKGVKAGENNCNHDGHVEIHLKKIDEEDEEEEEEEEFESNEQIPIAYRQLDSSSKRYECGICGKVVSNIKIHIRRHRNEKPFGCMFCAKRFTNSGDLQIHNRTHTGEKPYECSLCGKLYRTIGNFNSHAKGHDTGERPHRCSICNEMFEHSRQWASHLRLKHRYHQNQCTDLEKTHDVEKSNTRIDDHSFTSNN